MFSTGQLLFAVFFVIAFALVIFWTYRKDRDMHKRNYKGVKWVGIVFVIFVLALFLIKYLLKS